MAESSDVRRVDSASALQQGMSPTLPTLEGEDRGPSYADADAGLHRDVQNVQERQPSLQMPNGVRGGHEIPRREPDGPMSVDLQPSVMEERTSAEIPHLPGGGAPTTAQGDADVFTVIERPPLVAAENVSPAVFPRGDYAAGAMHNPAAEPLFPQFVPSPLPGQSPVAESSPHVTRGGSWFARIGDYLQRRVEVTSWSQYSGGPPQQWTSASVDPSPPARYAANRDPEPASVSSGGLSAEAVQAEVARQLETAMGDVMQKLNMERRKTEEAKDEARRLRDQLEQQRIRMTRVEPEASRLRTPPEPPALEDGPGILAEVPSDLPPRGPTGIVDAQVPLRLPGFGGLRDDGGQVPGSGGHLGDPLRGRVSDSIVYGAGIQPEVPSDLPPRGPLFEPRTDARTRSQSPSGPRAFLQNLLSLAGGTRDHSSPDVQEPSGHVQRTEQGLYQPPLPPPQQSPTLPIPRHTPPQPPRASGDYGPGGARDEGDVLLTLARGIEALLQQSQSGRGEKPETVKPGISELPVLAEYQPATGSIDLLNWITHIGPIMEDLSDTSLAWWESTMKDVLKWYQAYSTSAPLARLQLRPRPSEPLKPEWARVERRATAMLLSAIPKQVREEVIAHGEVTSLTLLCKLYAVYQPGNLQEKSLILKMLEQPEECQSALAAVEALRKWNLWRRRAASVGIAEPDASILLRGLDRITGAVVRGSGELSFRVSLIRSTLQVDVCPSPSSITSFVQHLQAEMEQQARLSITKPSTEESSALRALGPPRDQPTSTTPTSQPTSTTPPSPPKPPSNLCRFFASEKGCKRGNSCKFPHTWSLVDKSSRQKKCLNCGAQGHRAKECKAPGGGSVQPKGSSKGDTTGASDTGATSTSTPTSEASRRVNFNVGDIQAKVMRVLDSLKDIPVFGPVMASLGTWGHDKFLRTADNKKALLDSGATHPLRHPRDCGEWEQARDVSVQLAGDSRIQMKQTESGTLLSTDDLSQMIVPLGKVITTLGYKLCWTSTSCELVGPNNDVLPLEIRNGCPEISEKAAHKLIQQLEEQQLAELDNTTQTSLRTLTRLKASWWTYLLDCVKNGQAEQAHNAIDKAVFFTYKDTLKNHLVAPESDHSAWDMLKRLSVNRRARKRLLRAEAWIVRWDPPTVDRAKDPLRQLSCIGDQVYVNLNTLLMHNNFEDVWRILQWAALHGRVGSVVTRDCPIKPIEQVTSAPHRSKVHYLHALSSAAREVLGGGPVDLFVEDLDRVEKWTPEHSEFTSSLWPPWTLCKDSREYLDEMGLVDVSIARFPLRRQIRISKLNSEAAWRLHVARNHQPFRRDCSVCVRNSAAGHRHRTTAHPMAYSLSVDVVGPLKGYGKSPDGKFFKYFMIGAFRIPEVEGAGGHGEVRGHPLPPLDVDEDEDQLSGDEEEEQGDQSDAGGVAEADVDKEKRQWEELLSTFKAPISTTTLYFAVPVNNKKAATMLPAVQRIVSDVKALGYPVTRLHSDRGGEFRGNLVRKWALGQGMWPTTTSGSDSAANGVAESGVRFLKRRARILLDGAGINKENWPTAVQYAAAQQRCERLGELPPMLVAYGTPVYVKTKRYKTGAVEDFGPHWTRGRYVGPSTDIRGGHVILKDTGTFIQTTHVRITRDPPPLEEVMPTVVVEPDDEGVLPAESSEDGPPLPPPSLPPPTKRIRSKAPTAAKLEPCYLDYEVLYDALPQDVPLDEYESQVKYLRVGEIQYVEAVARQLCQDDRYNERDCARLLALFAGTCGNLKVPRAPLGTGMILGAYVHGGSLGITRYGRDLPWVASYFNGYLARKLRRSWPDMKYSWTTLAIQAAEDIPRHKDSHNERNSRNYVIELKTKSLDGLWVENQGGERGVVGGSHLQEYQHQDVDGCVYDGCLLDIAKKPAVFDPLVPHAYVKENKAKWFLSAYTPQGASKLSAVDLQYLQSLQFPVGREEGDAREQAGTLETRPMLKTASLPSEALQGGARGVGYQLEIVKRPYGIGLFMFLR